MALSASIISAPPSEVSSFSCDEFDASACANRLGRFFFSAGRVVCMSSLYFFIHKTLSAPVRDLRTAP